MGAPDEKPTVRREETGAGRPAEADLPTEEVRTEHLEAIELAPDDPSNLVPDTRVGPYRVLRQLGRGGMGAVYLADRADDEFRKKVALKVVQVGADRDRVVRRFRRERQILAALEHPNVSRLLDGGTTEAGLPYFVMEYIDGHPITRYCDSARLSVAERVRLFLGVCSAVQYLHRNLVVHQDIKPGNILVGADGVPRLLDFGIAKLVGPESSGEEATQTSVGLTPAYASPEQVRGETVTTASDVYSLGVLLYELLTGLYPYRVKSRQPFEFLKAVVEQEPERPSTAIDRTLDLEAAEGGAGGTAARVSLTREGSPERLRLRLRGDLDDIVLLTLRKEPAQRYPSVEAFAADLQRYLDGRPVEARKGSFAYRAGKFVRRNVWGVGAVAALVALLAGWGTTVSVQSRRIGRERDKAERIASFLTSLFEVSNPGEARGNSVTAREVLDKGAERIR
jgi:serine/threonine protein kinase